PQHGKSYLLSVYDLKTLREVKTKAPSFGGFFQWNGHHQIIHQWGCGTNCANFRIYDLQLNELFFTLSSGGFLLSPDYNYLIQFSFSGKRMWVCKLTGLKMGQAPLVYVSDIDTNYHAWDIVFVKE